MAAITIASLTVAAATTAVGAAPPPNPSDAQLANAAAAKQQAANDVGRLSGLIAGIDTKIVQLDGLAEAARAAYVNAYNKLQVAKALAVTARQDVQTARTAVNSARERFRQYIVVSYRQLGGDTSGLLTAADPNVLLARGDLNSFTSARNVGVIGDLTRATVRRSNADAAARTAVTNQNSLTAAADAAKTAAVQAVQAAQDQRVALAAQKSTYESQLQAAGMALTGLQDKRAAFLAWQVAEAKRKAAEAAARARALALLIQRQRQAAAAAAARAAAAAVAAAARAAANTNSGGDNSASTNSGNTNSGNTNSGGDNSGSVVIPTGDGSCNTFGGGAASGSGNGPMGTWTPAMGQAAVNRAMQCVGKPYAWDGGSFTGPTYGLCMDSVTTFFGDCRKVGFDCSGLLLYAWAPAGLYLSHYAPDQWTSGSLHPDLGSLMPGDLLFYSNSGTVASIHHVLMYIGNGMVIQAPQSGEYVEVVPLYTDGYFGAVRPLS